MLTDISDKYTSNITIENQSSVADQYLYLLKGYSQIFFSLFYLKDVKDPKIQVRYYQYFDMISFQLQFCITAQEFLFKRCSPMFFKINDAWSKSQILLSFKVDNCILLYYLVVFHLLEKLRKFLDIFSVSSRFKK